MKPWETDSVETLGISISLGVCYTEINIMDKLGSMFNYYARLYRNVRSPGSV